LNRTQIRVPEKLFKELRAFAEKREWSLAETFRRGAELLLQVYPDELSPPTSNWTPPRSDDAGWKDLNAAQLRAAAFSDADPQQP